jgi:hypothetical protein
MAGKKDKKVRKTYYDAIREQMKNKDVGEVEKPDRKHHLDAKDQLFFMQKMEVVGKFVTPYQEYGAYWGGTEALIRCGAGEFHPIARVLKVFEDCMTEPSSKDKHGRTAWDVFKNKPSRNRKKGLDSYGRFLQNFNVLQRIGGKDPYGLKLAQLGACVDMKLDEYGAPMIRLRAGIPRGTPVSPQNEIKKRHCEKAVSSIPSLAGVEELSLICLPAPVFPVESSGTPDEKGISGKDSGEVH